MLVGCLPPKRLRLNRLVAHRTAHVQIVLGVFATTWRYRHDIATSTRSACAPREPGKEPHSSFSSALGAIRAQIVNIAMSITSSPNQLAVSAAICANSRRSQQPITAATLEAFSERITDRSEFPAYVASGIHRIILVQYTIYTSIQPTRHPPAEL